MTRRSLDDHANVHAMTLLDKGQGSAVVGGEDGRLSRESFDW